MEQITQSSRDNQPTVFMSPLVHNRLCRIEEELRSLSSRLLKVESNLLMTMSPRGIAKFLFTNFKNENSNIQSSLEISVDRVNTDTDMHETVSKQSPRYNKYITKDTMNWISEVTRTVQHSISDTVLTPFFQSVIRYSQKRYVKHYERELYRRQELPCSIHKVYPKGLQQVT
jgi:hypothetical protein